MYASPRFIAVASALFFGSASATIAWCASMHGAPMCSVRTPSLGGGFAFLVTWLTMMVAMMLPSLTPMLLRYRQAIATARHVDALTCVVGLGYFSVWAIVGALAFAGEAALTDSQTHGPAFVGAIVFIAGLLQFSAWKTRHLVCCRARCCGRLDDDIGTAWRHGVRLGMHCVNCCWGLTAVLFAVGMMDVRAMALVTAAISLERLAPGDFHAARLVGVVLIAMGVYLLASATI